MIITKDGKIIRLESGEIRQAGRSTQGVRLVRMEDSDVVAAASCIPEPDEEGLKNGELPLAVIFNYERACEHPGHGPRFYWV